MIELGGEQVLPVFSRFIVPGIHWPFLLWLPNKSGLVATTPALALLDAGNFSFPLGAAGLEVVFSLQDGEKAS